MQKSLKAEQGRLFIVNAAIIILTIAAMSLVCVYSVAKDLTDDRTFARGITVNGLDLSGMTFSDAQRRLERYCEDELSSITVSLTYNGSIYEYSVLELGGVVDVADTLEKAFNIGKSADGSGSLENLSMSTELRLDIGVDREKLKDRINEIADAQNIPAKPAEAVFDKTTRTFTFTEGEPGLVINTEASADGIEAMFASGEFSSFELISQEQPQMSVEEVRENTKLISSFTTETTANYNRNVNINLMCEYVNGYVIEPGGILSINGLVGERTAEKGFMEAGAIIDGKLADEIGGGICQLSGTLYNAALLANMKIVERLPHTWPSDYLPAGLDSTLTMEANVQKDLKIQNPTEHPMYVAAWLERKNLSSANVLHVEIYGEPLPEGMTIKLKTETIETIEPKAAEIVYTKSLASGQRKEIKRERTGYRINAWREFYYDGKLIDLEPIDSSYYPPVQGKYEVGTGSKSSKTTTPNPDPTAPPQYNPDPPADPPVFGEDPTDPGDSVLNED